MEQKIIPLLLIGIFSLGLINAQVTNDRKYKGFNSLFDGKNLIGWKIPEGDNGHWKTLDGVIDYDALSEAGGDKNLWTEKEYKDFVLYVDWKIKETPFLNHRVRIVKPDGTYKLNEKGEEVLMIVPDSDSGILLRGADSNCQINIWCWPVGSGEVPRFRKNKSMPAETRKAVTPKINADNNIGEWNTFKITLKGNILNVELNGELVVENAELPGLPDKGAIGLQHHGKKEDGEWASPPSLVQFRNIYIKEI